MMESSDELLSKAWTVISEQLKPSASQNEDQLNRKEFCEAWQTLEANNLDYIVEEWFIETLQQDLRHRIGPLFWNFFKELENQTENSAYIQKFVESVNYLYEITREYRSCINLLESVSPLGETATSKNISSLIITFYKAIIFYTYPETFLTSVGKYYSEAFRVFHHINTESHDSGEEKSPLCDGCQIDVSTCTCQEIMETFHSVNKKLDDIGVLEKVSGAAVTSIVHSQIESYINTNCKGNFETSYFEHLEKWLDTKVLGWLNSIYAGEKSHNSISAFRGRLLHFLFETYANARIEQLFMIVIDYPESEPAILDLKTCLEKTNLRSQLMSSLRKALEDRLLHPGVNTTVILSAYISAIRSLRVLDPAGVILEFVSEPVRKYLRSREDTVRCIVLCLTEEGSNELLDELWKGQPLVLEDDTCSDEDEGDWETWMPDPVDADPSTTSKSRRASDIISMLVNIYGSKELFVNEYRTLLTDRILNQFNCDMDRELRYLEMLKLRFGESQLHYCEVMLKDVADSKRINSRIVQEMALVEQKMDIDINALILSAHFWPPLREEKITLPKEMQKSLEEYTKKFEALKGNRTLNWKPHLGMMKIEIEHNGTNLSFSVSPVHAAIIMQFQNKARWDVEELSGVLQMSVSALRRKITYWQTQGLLKEEVPDTFVLVDEVKGQGHEVVMVEDESESAMASAQQQREEELQVFWTYIVGMLTNLESLPLERIHTMLRMFAMQGPSTGEVSLPELKGFLDRKIREQKLVYYSGVYRLAK
ncbi:hypothetical protein SNE40_000298 [Patella caerulea]|uniref:Anaphase-promoting complex subunit 2 n=2 Tax=Patella caerulea TaxID=87958 RepID=A0AAN8KJC2_PATCE